MDLSLCFIKGHPGRLFHWIFIVNMSGDKTGIPQGTNT